MKINKKGYTLIELIMIITIMGLVMIIVFPSVMSMQNKNKKKEYEYYKDAVETASKLYFDSKGEDITSKYWHGCVALSYQELVNANLLKPFEKDGVTCDESKVYVSKNGDKITYQTYLKCKKTSNNEVMYESNNPYPGASCSLTMEDAPNLPSKEPNLAKYLMSISNNEAITNYENGNKSAPYTFNQTAGVQQTGWTSDDLKDYRYIGDVPNNYVYFNCSDTNNASTCEKYRIVGVFTVENVSGVKEKRVKIVRDNSLGAFSFDSTSVNIIDQTEGNNWIHSTTYNALNTTFYNRGSTTCYQDDDVIESTKKTVVCNFTNTGLLASAKALIGDAKYYISAMEARDKDAAGFYQVERGNRLISANYQLNFVNKIAFLYPSDYFYTFANGISANCYRNGCNTTEQTRSWMAQMFLVASEPAYFITPMTMQSSWLAIIGKNAMLTGRGYYKAEYFPTMYLNANVEWVSGSGSVDDPYMLKY